MGMIIGSAAKPKRCNLNKLSQLGTPAAGEHILVSSDNSMTANGQGNFDCYIVGDGTKAATVLELKKNGSDLAFINEDITMTVTPSSAVAFFFYVGVNYYISSNVNAVLSTRYVENGSTVETIGTVKDEILFTPTHSTRYLRIGSVSGTSANLTIKARGSLAQDFINAKSQQMLTAAEQKQARQNLGLGNGDIDTIPTAESGNVITSGGVYDIVGKTELSITSDSVTPLEMAAGKTYVIINTGTKNTPILSTRSTATGSNLETIATTILAGNSIEFTPSQACHYLRVGSGNATTLSVFLKTGLQNEVYNLKNRVSTNDASIEELAEKTEIFTKAVVYDEILTDSYINGKYINTNVAVGSTIDTTPVSNNSYAYIIYPCKQGDIFGITGNGGDTPRLWCFTDANYVKLSGNPTNIVVNDLFLTAPADGYFISNFNINTTHKLGVIFSDNDTQTIEGKVDSLVESVNELMGGEKVTKITDPHLLEWKIQGFTADGTITTNNLNRCHLIVRVKAGSKITALQANGVKFQRGYKLSESDTTLTDYATYAYGTYEFPVDCIAYIGLSYAVAERLYNDEIVDKISIDLNVVDFVSKYSKKGTFTFGSPLALMYAGQHEDNTGFNLQTQPAAVYSAFDSLVAASDGWLEKNTLGVIYEGTENEETIYTYTTKPRGIHNAISAMKLPKVAIVCCLHGGEKMSAYAMHYLLYDMLHNSSKNAVIQYLRSCCTLTFIPIANPWGFKAGSRLNQNGVNLNRNFPTYAWDEYSDDTSEIGGINYKGTAPCSEEETQMVVTFLQKHQDAAFAVDVHTNGGDTEYYYQICHVDVTASPSKSGTDYEIQSSYAIPSAIFVNSLKAWLDENYGTQLGNVFYGNVLVDDNALRPTASNWIRESNNMMGFTYEVMAGSSTGYLGEQLTQYGSETIKAAGEELGDFLIRMLEHCSKV